MREWLQWWVPLMIRPQHLNNIVGEAEERRSEQIVCILKIGERAIRMMSKEEVACIGHGLLKLIIVVVRLFDVRQRAAVG